VGLVSKEMVLQRVKSHVLLEVGSMYQVGRTFADCNVRMSPGGGVSRNFVVPAGLISLVFQKMVKCGGIIRGVVRQP
jgi:hypothetical protein